MYIYTLECFLLCKFLCLTAIIICSAFAYRMLLYADICRSLLHVNICLSTPHRKYYTSVSEPRNLLEQNERKTFHAT